MTMKAGLSLKKKRHFRRTKMPCNGDCNQGRECICECMDKPKMKHKWHKEIKAWADGAEIEVKTYETNDWRTVAKPEWVLDYYYRIKPQPKQPQYLYVYQKNSGYELGGEPHPAQQYYPIVGKIKLEVDDD